MGAGRARSPGWNDGLRGGAIIAGFILIASVVMMFGENNRFHDADSVLPSIMSVEKLTWYYWNQNRFGNLLPFLASPLHDIRANLRLQIVLRLICGFLSVFFALELIGDRDLRYERFFVSIIVLMVAARGFAANFFVTAVPTPEFCAVFVLGLWLLDRQPAAGVRRGAAWIAATAIFWLAFFVNLSLLVFLLPLCVAFWWLRVPPLGRFSGCAAVWLAAFGAWLHARRFNPRTPSNLHFRWDSLNAAADAILPQVNLTMIVGMLIAVAGLAALLHGRAATPDAGEAAIAVPTRHLAVLGALALTAVVFADSFWVQANGNAPRYYDIVRLFVILLPASWAVTLLRDGFAARGRHEWFAAGTARVTIVRPWTVRACRVGLPLLALLAVAAQAGLPGPLGFISNIPADRRSINDDIPEILAHVPADRPMLVVGSFWTTALLAYARLAQDPGSESLATAFHWEAMRPEIHTLLSSGRPFTLVCMPWDDPNPPECLTSAEKFSDAPRIARATSVTGSGVLRSGGAYRVLAVPAMPEGAR